MITVITICYNAEKEITKTLKSVVNQKECDFEYVIKDACSKDRTNQIIDDFFSDKPFANLVHISCKDDGIYSGMNQAVEKSTGEWIIFMNAGDMFYDDYVLHEFEEAMERSSYDVYYGHTLVDAGGRFLVQIHNHEHLLEMFSLGHQSCMVRKELLTKYPFDENYKIAGDYDFFYRIYKEGYTFESINLIASVYNRDGVSAQRSKQSFWENARAKRQNESLALYIKYFIWKVKTIIVYLFPQMEQRIFCNNYLKRNGIYYAKEKHEG